MKEINNKLKVYQREDTDGTLNEYNIGQLLNDKFTQKDINQYSILKLVNSSLRELLKITILNSNLFFLLLQKY